MVQNKIKKIKVAIKYYLENIKTKKPYRFGICYFKHKLVATLLRRQKIPTKNKINVLIVMAL